MGPAFWGLCRQQQQQQRDPTGHRIPIQARGDPADPPGPPRVPAGMTQAEIKLCSLLLREHFGEIVERVGTLLVRAGAQPLRMLVGDTGLSLEQVGPGPGGAPEELGDTPGLARSWEPLGKGKMGIFKA